MLLFWIELLALEVIVFLDDNGFYVLVSNLGIRYFQIMICWFLFLVQIGSPLSLWWTHFVSSSLWFKTLEWASSGNIWFSYTFSWMKFLCLFLLNLVALTFIALLVFSSLIFHWVLFPYFGQLYSGSGMWITFFVLFGLLHYFNGLHSSIHLSIEV